MPVGGRAGDPAPACGGDARRGFTIGSAVMLPGSDPGLGIAAVPAGSRCGIVPILLYTPVEPGSGLD